MLEQELASIIKYVLDSSGNPTPYYWNIPQSFAVPAAYFPQPEIDTDRATLNDYSAEYSWYINFFDSTTQGAHEHAFKALTAIVSNRRAIPLIDTDGSPTGKIFRISDVKLRTVDDGVVQLTVNFTSYRKYTREEVPQMQSYEASINGSRYTSIEISEAMENALERYLKAPRKGR